MICVSRHKTIRFLVILSFGMPRLQILLDENCIKLVKLASVHYNMPLTTIANDALKEYIKQLLLDDDDFFQLVNSSSFDNGSKVEKNLLNPVRKIRQESKG